MFLTQASQEVNDLVVETLSQLTKSQDSNESNATKIRDHRNQNCGLPDDFEAALMGQKDLIDPIEID